MCHRDNKPSRIDIRRDMRGKVPRLEPVAPFFERSADAFDGMRAELAWSRCGELCSADPPDKRLCLCKEVAS